MEIVMQNIEKPLVWLDGLAYDFDELPQVARDTLISLRFVDPRLQQLRGELAVSQTAHVAYASALKAELDQMARPLLSVPPSP